MGIFYRLAFEYNPTTSNDVTLQKSSLKQTHLIESTERSSFAQIHMVYINVTGPLYSRLYITP